MMNKEVNEDEDSKEDSKEVAHSIAATHTSPIPEESKIDNNDTDNSSDDANNGDTDILAQMSKKINVSDLLGLNS